MGLSYDIISEFVKITNDKKEAPKEGMVYATIVNGSDGKFVKIDGSDLLTPMDTTTDIEDGERVTLMIKDHKAIVTGNVTNPSASTGKVDTVIDSISSVSDRVGTFELVVADKVSTKELEAYKATIEVLIAGKATIEDLTATNAKIENLEVKNAEIENLVAEKATITDLEAVNATIENLKVKDAEIEHAVIENLEATTADIKILNADFAQIKTLVNGNLTSDNILSFNLTSEKVTVENAFIKDAMIDTISAGKINAGKINTNSVSIGSEDGGMLITGSTQQFTDKNGRVRIQIGKDASGDFTFVLYGEDGTGQLINQNGITASAIGDGLIVNDMVSDNAAISGGKLDISSVITEINSDNSTTIKSSKIYLNEQAQSLEVAFNSLKTKVDTIQDVTIDGDLNAIVEQVQSNTSKIEVNSEKIGTLISQDTVIKKQVTDLQGSLSETETTLTSKYTSLNQSLDGFKSTVADTYATKKSVTDVANNVSANYSTTSVMNSAINQKAQEISASVSSTYATKNEVKTLDDTLKTDYSTTQEMESAINVAKEEINLGVSSIYETKENVTTKVTSTLNSAKSYADTKKTEAISTAASDATTKANNAKSEAITSANKTLTSTISNYYTKAQTDSQINVAKEAINLGVSTKYETKENVQTKVTSTLNSAKSYADTKKTEAISSAATDASTKVNAAKTELNTAIDKKANSADVYKKSEVYTKAQTDSQINVAKDEINLGVSNTYETKANVATKVSNAVTEARRITDTRSTNQNPQWYMTNYPRQTINEFKHANAIGIPNSTINYGTLTTNVPWNDYSGGYPVQTFRSSDYKTYERKGTSNTAWSAWVQVENAVDSQAKANAAKQEAINSANSTLNTTIANYYTKTQTDSQINVAKNAITQSVSNTYETKTNVQNKIDAIQVGGTNLIKKKSGFTYGYLSSSNGSTTNTGSLNSNQDFYTNDYIFVKAGTPIIFSSYPKQGVTSKIQSAVYIHLYNTNKVWQWCKYNITNANQSARVTYTTEGDCYIRFSSRGFNDYNHKAEYGTKATDWSPAPEDIETTVSNLTQRVSTAESKITDTAITNVVKQNFYTKTETNNQITSKGYQTASQVQQTVNNLQLKFTQSGGYNLFSNSGFKKGTSYWSTHTHDSPTGGSIGTLTSSATWGFPDSTVNCVQIRLSNQSGKEYGIAQAVKTTIGKKYTLSFYYAGHRLNQINAIVRNSSGGWLANKYVNTLPSGGNTNVGNWNKYTLTFTANATSHSINIVIVSAADDGYLWVAKPMVVEGELDLPYSPNPSEVYDGITTIDKDGIKVSASNINGYTHMTSLGFFVNKGGKDIVSVDNHGLRLFDAKIQLTHANGNKYFMLNENGIIMYNPANGTHQWGKVAAINNKFTVASNGNSIGLSLGHHVNENYVEDILCDSHGVVTVQRQINHNGVFYNNYGQMFVRQSGQGGWEITGRSDSQAIKPGGANQGAIGSNTQYINQSWIANRNVPSSLEVKHLSHYIEDNDCISLVNGVKPARYFYKEYDEDGNDITTFTSKTSQLGLIYEDVRECAARDLLTNEDDKGINLYGMVSVLWGAVRNLNTRLNEAEYEIVLLNEELERIKNNK